MSASEPRPGVRLRYCNVRVGSEDPADSVSRTLEGSGVRIERIDRRNAKIRGTIEPTDGSPVFRVVVSLFPRTDVCFVEIACEGIGEAVLAADLLAMQLACDLRGALPPKDPRAAGFQG